MTEPYLFNSIFLIVGTNPLPNFAVAECFLNHNKNLTDFYTISWMRHKPRKEQENMPIISRMS